MTEPAREEPAVPVEPVPVEPVPVEPVPVEQAVPAEEHAASVEGEAGAAPPRSGLRNPQAAVRGLGAGTLALEAIVLLLAIQPIRIMGGDLGGWGVAAVVTLAVLAGVLAGTMRRRWAWAAGTVLQALLIASGLLHWSLAVLGLIFAGAWAYASYVRKTILG